jgi:hypothetical protein
MPSRQGDRHGWNSLDHYLTIHESILAGFSDFFIHRLDLDTKLIDYRTVTIRGRIFCEGGIYLDVNKILALNERSQVRTIYYSYQACINLESSMRIFRYDNAHRYVREGHPDAHHKHLFDQRTGRELPASPEWIGYDRWPTIGDVLSELHEWQQEVGRHLQDEQNP